jgi:D-alanine-D-alanine ligase
MRGGPAVLPPPPPPCPRHRGSPRGRRTRSVPGNLPGGPTRGRGGGRRVGPRARADGREEAEPTRRIRVGVIFGGRSGEHEVSLRSAVSVLAALDPRRFEAVPLGITREGRWLLPGDALRLLEGRPEPEGVAVGPLLPRGAAAPEAGEVGRALVGRAPDGAGLVGGAPAGDGGRRASAAELLPALDVVFPVVHGPNGEDGTLQGLLEMCGLPYVGAGVLGSALGMDKVAQKDILVRHGLPVADYEPVLRHEWVRDAERVRRRVLEHIGLPCFVKPANLGSSVGVTKVHTAEELEPALALAASLDRRVVCERAVDAREIECGVLGNDEPAASVPGEVVPEREFYDYEAKYGEDGCRLIVPAELPPAVTAEVRDLAVRVFAALDCAGMARVDFFLERATGRLLVNELNTIPGFTATSMYARLWAASGVPFPELLTRLVELALERHAARRRPAAPAGEGCAAARHGTADGG